MSFAEYVQVLYVAGVGLSACAGMHLESRISEPWSTCGTDMPLRRYVPPIVLLTFPCGNNRREADGKTI